MKISKLFHVLVVTGASTTVGIGACGGDDTTGSPAGVGNAGTDTGGAGTSGGNGSSGSSDTGGSAGTMSSAGGSGGTASTGGSGGSGGDSSTGGSGGTRAGSGGSGGAGGAGMSGGGGSAGAGGAASCTIVDSPCGFGYKDYNGCCCWIIGPKAGRCTEPGCAAHTACCKGNGPAGD